TALLLAVNGAIYEVILARRWRPAVATAGALVLVLGYGELRLRQVDAAVAAAPEVTIGVVQGNVPFSEKGYEHPEVAAKQLADLKDRSVELERAGADLIVWPETALPYVLPRSMTHEPRQLGIRSEAGRRLFKTPLLFGALTVEVDDSGQSAGKDPYNSAIFMDPDGRFV